jgi:hypothetical protein
VSDVDPAEISAGQNPEFVPELIPAATRDRSDQKKPVREGLPSTYRMRADAHYVDQLGSKRAEPAHDGGRRADALLAQLAQAIGTIESTAAALGADPSVVARRVNLDLIKSHAWRAAWLIRADAIARGARQAQLRRRPLGSLLGQLRTGFAPDCRLQGIQLQIHTADWDAVIAADEEVLLTGMSAAVLATMDLIGAGESGTIKVSVVASAGSPGTIAVTQDDSIVHAGLDVRFFDTGWTDRPGGWHSALAAAAIRAAARMHGGDAALLVTEQGGSSIQLTFGAR